MLQLFTNFIKKENLFQPENKILLAVSGGIDSVVMLDLFVKAGFESAGNYGIAHCNFKLRGDESDKDEEFVKNLSEKHNLHFHKKSFDTATYSQNNNISIQMAARELRYQWFEEIRKKYNYDFIAVAHHQDDVVETFLMNIARGTGIKGLTGIQPKINKIIRPLLFATKNQIELYCKEQNLKYREDTTNVSLKYARNIIRHKIIPPFHKINQNFNQTIIENIERFKEMEQVYKSVIDDKKQQIVIEKKNKVLINIPELKKLNPLPTYLYEFLYPYGFVQSQCTGIVDMILSLKNISGKQFFSPTHRLIIDRDYLIITKTPDNLPCGSQEYQDTYVINKDIKNITEPIKLNIKKAKNTPDFKIPSNPKIACIDYELVEYPLILRKWKNGDYFMPLGMKQKKKLSDFFVDSKMSIYDKENTWILASGNKIIWVVGKRIDERFKITEKTKNILLIEIKV